MELFIKLLLAHILGDFIFQTSGLVKRKEKHKLASPHLYLHVAIHGVLTLLLLLHDHSNYWYIAIIIAVTHLIIDALKLYFTTKKNRTTLFFLDQLAHITLLVGITLIVYPDLTLDDNIINTVLALLLCTIFLTAPVSIMLKTFFMRWENHIEDSGVNSLKNAGKWIGMLERLFVFVFIITNHWEAVGFLLTAKSVFRFGDLSKAKNMKLTEYVLIGTLLSFGIAILTGLFFNIAIS